MRKAGFQTTNQFSLFWRTGFQEERAETRIPLGKLGLMENLKTPAHHQLHPCKPPHPQRCSECLDVKKQSWPSWKMSRLTVSRMSRLSPSRNWTKFSTTFFQPRPSFPPTGHRQPPKSTRNGFLRASFLRISGKLLFFKIGLGMSQDSLDCGY